MNPRVSNALQEVWDMKRTVSEETKHLSGTAYFRYLREEAARLFPHIQEKTFRRHGGMKAEEFGRVAEGRDEYGKQQDGSRIEGVT